MAYNFKDKTVLFVDDDLTIKMLMAHVFKIQKFRACHVASNGKQGLEDFKQYKPDIVITDWHMPEMDGVELTRGIRAFDKKIRKMTPVILMSGMTSREVLKQALDVGVTEFLAKPFSVNDITKRVGYVFAKPRALINIDTYYGPDRRRIIAKDFKGPYKRKEDK